MIVPTTTAPACESVRSRASSGLPVAAEAVEDSSRSFKSSDSILYVKASGAPALHRISLSLTAPSLLSRGTRRAVGRECLYGTREHGVESGGAHPSKITKGEAACLEMTRRWASPEHDSFDPVLDPFALIILNTRLLTGPRITSRNALSPRRLLVSIKWSQTLFVFLQSSRRNCLLRLLQLGVLRLGRS